MAGPAISPARHALGSPCGGRLILLLVAAYLQGCHNRRGGQALTRRGHTEVARYRTLTRGKDTFVSSAAQLWAKRRVKACRRLPPRSSHSTAGELIV